MLKTLKFWKSTGEQTATRAPAPGLPTEGMSDELRARLLILALKNGNTRVLRPS